jgi:HEAT repeats
MEKHASRDFCGELRLWLVVASGVMVASGLLYYGLLSRVPRYQGKTSAEWFREFQKAASRHWTVPVVSPSGSGKALDLPALLREPAATGLRALGTNAAVYLGHQFARKEGIVALTYRKLYFQLPAPLKRFLLKPPISRSYLQMEIGLALEALGPNASAAAPSLIAALRSGDRFTVQTTLQSLQRMDFDRNQLDSVLEDWSKEGKHTDVVQVVGELRVRTAVAARCLARALSAGDPALRRSCVAELEQFRAAGVLALPKLTAALKDPDDQVRYGAARALEAVGNGAAAAIPDLMQATNDSSVMVQRASARALRVIQGQGAD